MDSFQWNETFETGLAKVDQQHKCLVELINKYSEQLSENELALDDISSVCTELFDYAKYHFQDEEALMSQAGIDTRHIDFHKEAHRHFLDEAISIQLDLAEKKAGASQQLLHFLIHWLAYHILHVDQSMARQVTAIGAGTSPGHAYEAEERNLDAATGPLVGALIGLFRLVSERNKDLDKANQLLEAKVAERTKELSTANLRLEDLALTDSLTHLPNRRHAMRSLTDLWEESNQALTPLVCVMIDADHFKEVNDTHGHDAGDAVLCELARTLQQTMRTDDIVCRLGGDEFLLICPNTNQDGGMGIAEIVRSRVATLRVPTGDKFWRGSISAGVAAKDPRMESYEQLIKLADDGVYAAKRDGRNCVRNVNQGQERSV